MRKNHSRIQPRFGLDHRESRRRKLVLQLKSANYVTNSLDPGACAAQKKRNIGAQRQGDRVQLLPRQFQLPQAVERQQRAGRVRRSATQAGLCGDVFRDADMYPLRATGGLLQRTCGAHDQIVRRQGAGKVFTCDGPIAAHLEMQNIAPIDQHEDRLQQVIAIGPATRDMQKQVQFGRRRHVVQGLHGKRSEAQDNAQRSARQRLLARGRQAPLLQGIEVGAPAGDLEGFALQPAEKRVNG